MRHHVLTFAFSTILLGLSACSNTSTNIQYRQDESGSSTRFNTDTRLGVAAAHLDSTGEVSIHPWRYAGYDGNLIVSPHYRIHTTLEYPEIVDQLGLFYESALDWYTTALTPLPKPDSPLETYLFHHRKHWRVKTQEMLPDQANLFMSLGRGGFTTQGTSVLYYIDRAGRTRDTFAIAAHEGWHQYTQQTFKHQLPIWLEEGLATYMEGYTNVDGEVTFKVSANQERRVTLAIASRRNRLIDLKDLLTQTPQYFLNDSKDELLIYYSQVWALTRFLAEGKDGKYREALTELISDAAHGRFIGRMGSSKSLGRQFPRELSSNKYLGRAVIREYFDRDVDSLDKEYNEFINQLIQENGGSQHRWWD